MSEVLASTLSVTFEPGDGSHGLLLERHIGFTGLSIGVPFRLYPPCEAKLVCAYGRISDIPESRVSDEKEVVTFSGSKTANLKKPGATNVSIEILRQVSFDENGDVIYPTVTFDTKTQQLVADQAFYGAVKVTYQCAYYLYFYLFATNDYDFGGSVLYGDDTIHAFYLKNHAELKMDNSFKKISQWLPLYTVTSKIVLDEKGVWEYPMNWESVDNTNKTLTQDNPNRADRGMGKFPGYTSYEIDPDQSFTDERVHQTGKYDYAGFVRVDMPNEILTVQEPYNNSWSFQELGRANLVRFHLKFASKPTWKKGMSYSEMHWIQAWASIDKTAIHNELKEDYPGIVKDGV